MKMLPLPFHETSQTTDRQTTDTIAVPLAERIKTVGSLSSVLNITQVNQLKSIKLMLSENQIPRSTNRVS